MSTNYQQEYKSLRNYIAKRQNLEKPPLMAVVTLITFQAIRIYFVRSAFWPVAYAQRVTTNFGRDCRYRVLHRCDRASTALGAILMVLLIILINTHDPVHME
jgi:hypothetical protein